MIRKSNVRKSITTTAMATLVLGSVFTPSALARTHAQERPNANYTLSKKSIYINDKLVSTSMGLVARDPNTHLPTTYMPIWYVFQALKSVGVEYSWDGHNLNITPTNGMPLTLSNLHPGQEDVHFYINGTLVDTAMRIVARDPYSHVNTSYIPIWYVQYVLKHMGIESTWNGVSWYATTPSSMVQKLTISARAGTVATGMTDQLSAFVTYADGHTATLMPGQVTWSTNQPDNAFVSPSQMFVAVKPGDYTVTGSFNGVTQTIPIHVFGSTASIQMKANGPLVANGVSTQSITVVAVDTVGSLNQNENGTVVVSADQPWIVTGTKNGTNVLGKSVAVQLKNGVGTLNLQAPSIPGVTAHLAASSLSDVQVNSGIQYGTLQVTSVNQQATALSIQPSDGNKYLVANLSGNKATFEVQVHDQDGQPMVGGAYPFQISVSGSASYNGPSTGVYQGGHTPTIVTVESKQGEAGPVSVSVSGSGLTGATATIQAVIAASATQLKASPTDGWNGFTEGSKVTYNLTPVDQNNLPTTFPSTPLTVYVANSRGETASNIQVNGVSETTNGVALGSNRTVTFSDTAKRADAGSYSVTIRDSSGHTWASFQVNETPAKASKLTLWSESPELPVANPWTALSLQYTDAYGNRTSGPASAAQSLTLIASGGQGKATVNGSDASHGVHLTTDANGKVTATFAAQPYAGSTWKLIATDGKLTSNSISISVVTAVASQAIVGLKDASTGSATDASAGDPLKVTFAALDNYGNAYNGNDTFEAIFPTGALTGVSGGSVHNDFTTVTGNLTQLAKDFANARLATAQTLTVQLADVTLSSAKSGSASIRVVPGIFHGFSIFDGQNHVISSANPTLVTSNSPVEVWVRPVDAWNNPIGAAPGQFTVDLFANGTGSFRLSPAASDVQQMSIPNGSASQPVFYVNKNGSYVLTASLSVLDPSHSWVKLPNYQPYQTKSKTNGSGTVTVLLKDQNGLPVAGQASSLTTSVSTSNVFVGSFTESASTPGLYTAPVTSSANHSNVVISVKDNGTPVGNTAPFNA